VSPYEEPEKPDLVIDRANESLDACVEKVDALLKEKGIIPMTAVEMFRLPREFK
jgi:adenylylsulfate kinase-like enzyme